MYVNHNYVIIIIKNIWKVKLFFTLIFISSSIFDIIINPTFAYETAINHVESSNNGLKVVDGINYQDGTILLRLLNPLNYCNENTIYLRLVHTNETVTTLNLNNLNIPWENFCYKLALVANSKQSSGGSSSGDSITINAIAYKYILINYFCNRSISNKVCGDVVTWTGELVSNIEFENVCDDSIIIQSHKKDDGFLRVCYVKDTKEIIWTKYSVPNISTGTILETSTGKLTDITNFNPNITKFFSREDGSYAMVTCTTDTKTTTDSNQFTGDWTIAVTFLSVDDSLQPTGPFELYKSKTNGNGSIDIVNIHRCDLAYYFSGYSCLITIVRSTNISFIDIDFTSSGNLYSVTPEFSIAQVSNTTTTIWDVQTLYYGGYVILVETVPTGNVDGHICSNNGTYFGNWSFSSQYQYTNKIAGVLPDNTLWTIPKQPTDDYSWTCLLTDALTNYSTVQGNNGSFNTISGFPGGPGGYGSDSILSTVPEKNSSIISANTDSITITYTKSVKKSSGNINIYQLRSSTNININNNDDYYDESEDLLRQSCSGQSDYVQIEGNTVQVKVLKSTFNSPGSEYYVTIEDDFVKDSVTNQNLFGIKPKIWDFNTEGTTYYTSLSINDQLDFVGKLSNELSNALPCDIARIKISTKYQYSHNNHDSINDNLSKIIFKNYEMNITTNSTDQIFMRIDIEGTSSITELSAIQLASDLNELIINKNATLLSKGLYTNLIDSGYGAEQLDRTRRYKSAQSFLATTMFIFITTDFCLDIVFVSIHGKDFKWLYLSSFGSIIGGDSSGRDEYDDRKLIIDNKKSGSSRRKKSSSISRKGSTDDTYSSSEKKKRRSSKSNKDKEITSMFDEDYKKSRSINKEKNVAPDSNDDTNLTNILFSSPILLDTPTSNIGDDPKSSESEAANGKDIDDNSSNSNSDSQRPEDSDYENQGEPVAIYKNITSGILETEEVGKSSTGIVVPSLSPSYTPNISLDTSSSASTKLSTTP
ncbi:4292_t:CDS:2 [Entrophospora sp. SA101]|nr:4292_t:CDS:2 [Entrophospora sp. SA101]